MITIGIGDLNVAKVPNVLITYALGSCVGICLHDANTNTAGMAHIMLPSSINMQSDKNPYKYADLAIPALVKKMEQIGAKKQSITAKIAGGAQMFETFSDSPIGKIGDRNVAAVKEVLAKLGIPIIADDTGKNYGRTVLFDPKDGKMIVRTGAKKESVF